MPLDFRYHLASLTAVFVALIIGILLGVAMTDAPGLRGEIEALRKEFRRSEQLQDLARRTNRFNERTLPLLVRNRMFGRNVILVHDALAFPDDEVAAVRQALEHSGATITAEVALKSSLLLASPEVVQRVYLRMQMTPPARADAGSLMTLLGASFGSALTPVAPAMHKEKLLSVRGDVTLPISTVVLLGGGSAGSLQSARVLDQPLLQACAERQLRLAAVETLDTPQSAIPLYRKIAPITVDNIDHAAGRIALIVALADNQRGDYGYKETASDVAPDFTE